jgi:hypothetical protein
MKYITVNADGVTEIRLDSSEVLPEGGIEVSDEEYSALLAGTKVVVNGAIVLYIPPPPPTPDPDLEINNQISALEAQFTDTITMRAILGDLAARDEVQSILTQIDTLKAQL